MEVGCKTLEMNSRARKASWNDEGGIKSWRDRHWRKKVGFSKVAWETPVSRSRGKSHYFGASSILRCVVQRELRQLYKSMGRWHRRMLKELKRSHGENLKNLYQFKRWFISILLKWQWDKNLEPFKNVLY